MNTEKVEAKKIWIYAGSQGEAIEFAQFKKLPPQGFRYISNRDALRGVPMYSPFIRVGTWYKRPDCYDINESIANRQMEEIADVMVKP